MDRKRPGWGAALVVVGITAGIVGPGAGCASVDLKGRETLRLGPLRDVALAPTEVAPGPVTLDAGTDALTDPELGAIAAALPAELSRALAERAAASSAPRALGRALIRGCRLRAGPGRAHTVYEARCRVVVEVGGTPVVEVHAEALRRVRARAISEDEARAIRKLERNPLLSADDGRLALVAALQAAAALIVDGRLPPVPDAPGAPQLARPERAALARGRLARQAGAVAARAALFELAESGTPRDAEAVLPFLVHDELAVRVAAVDALGELCAPWSAERLEPLTVDNAGEPALRQAADRALTRVRACASLTP